MITLLLHIPPTSSSPYPLFYTVLLSLLSSHTARRQRSGPRLRDPALLPRNSLRTHKSNTVTPRKSSRRRVGHHPSAVERHAPLLLRAASPVPSSDAAPAVLPHAARHIQHIPGAVSFHSFVTPSPSPKSQLFFALLLLPLSPRLSQSLSLRLRRRQARRALLRHAIALLAQRRRTGSVAHANQRTAHTPFLGECDV